VQAKGAAGSKLDLGVLAELRGLFPGEAIQLPHAEIHRLPTRHQCRRTHRQNGSPEGNFRVDGI